MEIQPVFPNKLWQRLRGMLFMMKLELGWVLECGTRRQILSHNSFILKCSKGRIRGI